MHVVLVRKLLLPHEVKKPARVGGLKKKKEKRKEEERKKKKKKKKKKRLSLRKEQGTCAREAQHQQAGDGDRWCVAEGRSVAIPPTTIV